MYLFASKLRIALVLGYGTTYRHDAFTLAVVGKVTISHECKTDVA